MPIFDQTCGITPLEKCHFFDLVKMTLLRPKSLVFYLKQHQTIYLGILKRKTTFEENANFYARTLG